MIKSKIFSYSHKQGHYKMLEILEDTIIDSLRLVPFLFITYIIMELIETHAGEKTEKAINAYIT